MEEQGGSIKLGFIMGRNIDIISLETHHITPHTFQEKFLSRHKGSAECRLMQVASEHDMVVEVEVWDMLIPIC